MKLDLLDIPIPCRKALRDLTLSNSSDYNTASVIFYLGKKTETDRTSAKSESTPMIKISERCLHYEVISAGCNSDRYQAAAGSVKLFWMNTTQKVGVVGCGEKLDFDSAVLVGNSIGKHLAETVSDSCSIVLLDDMVNRVDVRCLGVLLHRVFFSLIPTEQYKGTSPKTEQKIKSLYLHCPYFSAEEIQCVFDRAKKLAMANLFGASLIDAPPNYCNCRSFVATVRGEAQRYPNVEIKVLDENQCRELKMGAFLAVAQGSRCGARLLHLTYRNGQPKQKYALLGKGITLDSGGYGVKPAAQMHMMKMDMAGAAVVTASLLAAAAIGIKDVEIHSVAMLCENMIDKDAYRPGDIVTASNGKTIEVIHTDAEGRLALADGLIYAQKQLGSPGEGIIFDVATLTGAVLTALGDKLVGVYSNRDGLRDEVVQCMKKSGQPGWPMPLERSYRKHLEGDLADLKNANFSFAFGGSITAALFLENFVNKETPWVHLDISGPQWSAHSPGWGVEFFSHFLSKSVHENERSEDDQ